MPCWVWSTVGLTAGAAPGHGVRVERGLHVIGVARLPRRCRLDGPDRRAVTKVGCQVRAGHAPGERPEYHRGYWAAFVLDPDGHNVEAVFHDR